MFKKETLLRIVVEKHWVSPGVLLTTQLYTVGLFDTYINGDLQSKVEDELYFRIITDADKYNYRSPQVELARLNYGNALYRQNLIEESLQMYLTAVKNMKKFRDDSRMTRDLKVHVYISSVQTLMDMNLHSDQISILLDELWNLLKEWEKKGIPCLAEECAYQAANLRRTTESFEKTRQIAELAYLAFKLAEKSDIITPYSAYYHEALCYLPSVIAGYYIDRIDEIKCLGDKDIYIDRCMELCNGAVKNAQRIEYIDKVMFMVMQSKGFHQLGFLFANMEPERWAEALEYYLKAYDLRKETYNLTKANVDKSSIAETAVNIGGLILQIAQNGGVVKKGGEVLDNYVTAISYSEIAVKIYEELLRSGEEESELNYYKAVQLKGSILYWFSTDDAHSINKNEGIKLLQKAYQWNKEHPLNTYKGVFEGVAGVFLKKEKLI